MKKQIIIDFPDDFIPPDDFDPAGRSNRWHSKCDACPFYVFDEQGDVCQFPSTPDSKCPIKKYFEINKD